MKHADIVIGTTYAVKVSGRLAPVTIASTGSHTAYGTYASASINGSIYGRPRVIRKFYGINEKTGRRIGPFTAAKCRFEVTQLPSGVWARMKESA